MSAASTARIRELNDSFRRSFCGGRVNLTVGVASLPAVDMSTVLERVQTFGAFCAANDPYAEHDFGAIDYDGMRYFWKIDYYDQSLQGASPDPSDPHLTMRVLTVMRADEY